MKENYISLYEHKFLQVYKKFSESLFKFILVYKNLYNMVPTMKNVEIFKRKKTWNNRKFWMVNILLAVTKAS